RRAPGYGRDAAEDDARLLDRLAGVEFDGDRRGREREIERVALLELQIGRARGEGRRRHLNLRNNLVVGEHVLAPDVSPGRQREEFFERDGALAARADNARARAECDE